MEPVVGRFETRNKSGNHQDLEYEIGALASRHGISVDQAREIVEHCGKDLDCIDAEAKKLKAH